MKIRDLSFGKYPLFLAPMEDVTDPAFRLMCKKFGADMVYTEFISSDALIRSVSRTQQKLKVYDEERPVGIQIYGKQLDAIVEAAKICEIAQPNLIDLNFGCPVRKVAGKGAGAGLLKEPDLMIQIIEAVSKAVKIPVTVKTRLGWDENDLIITELAERIQDAGAEALTIHGRTRSQMYTGKANWELIGKVKNNPRIHIPIIGNGDISTPQEAKNAFETYGVDAIMIGRGTFGCPWIFKEISYFLKHNELITPFEKEWQLSILKKQVLNSVEWLDERKGILHIRRHLAASPLFKGLSHFKEIRVAMLRAATVEELFEIMDTQVLPRLLNP